MNETNKQVSQTAFDLPIGSVFQGYYYPPTFSLTHPSEKKLASMQFTRGRTIVYAERAEYSLYQEWERIEILFTPHRHAADTPEVRIT